MHESIVFFVRVQCRRKESSRSLSHLLMSFLYTPSSQSCNRRTVLSTTCEYSTSSSVYLILCNETK